MRADVRDWLARRSYGTAAFADLPALLAAKGERTVGLVVPTLNEASTIGGLLDAVHDDPTARALLDDVVVIDGGSHDDTRAIAQAAGARVLVAADFAPSHPAGGKGGSVWRALQATTSDLLVVVDADLDPFDPGWVVSLVAPLLLDPTLHLVKAASERGLLVEEILHPRSGGRVTELVARPLLNALWPELAGVVQPLSGELAARRDLLEALPFAIGYGLEIGMLIDTLALVGLDGIGQVNLGERRHRHHSDLAVARMASAVLRTALARTGLPDLPDSLLQFTVDDNGEPAVVSTVVPVTELPAVLSLRAAVR